MTCFEVPQVAEDALLVLLAVVHAPVDEEEPKEENADDVGAGEDKCAVPAHTGNGLARRKYELLEDELVVVPQRWKTCGSRREKMPELI